MYVYFLSLSLPLIFATLGRSDSVSNRMSVFEQS